MAIGAEFLQPYELAKRINVIAACFISRSLGEAVQLSGHDNLSLSFDAVFKI